MLSVDLCKKRYNDITRKSKSIQTRAVTYYYATVYLCHPQQVCVTARISSKFYDNEYSINSSNYCKKDYRSIEVVLNKY